jgi:DNA-binding GntR family transcriptional regulator
MSTNTKLAEALRANHKWHQDHDDYAGYPGSELEEQNCAALAAHDAEQAAKAVPADLRSAAERTRQDLGPTGSNYPDVRVLLAFVEQALAAHTPPAPDCED